MNDTTLLVLLAVGLYVYSQQKAPPPPPPPQNGTSLSAGFNFSKFGN